MNDFIIDNREEAASVRGTNLLSFVMGCCTSKTPVDPLAPGPRAEYHVEETLVPGVGRARNYNDLCTIGFPLKVYDGDTFTKMQYFDPISGASTISSIRLAGFDAPEIRVPKAIQGAERTQLKQRGIAARDYMQSLVKGKVIFMRFIGVCPYGRLVAKCWALPNDHPSDHPKGASAFKPVSNRNPASITFSQVEYYEQLASCTESLDTIMIKSGHIK